MGAIASSTRREAILRAASHLFEHRGYYGTTMRMIASEAHITPSLLQKYYPTKGTIIAEFVERAIDEFDGVVKTMHRQIATISGARPLLLAVGRTYIAFVDRMRGFYLTWIMCPELIEPYREALPEFIWSAHKLLAKTMADRTGFDEERALLRTQTFLGALFAWVLYYRRVGIRAHVKAESKEERLARLVTTVLKPKVSEDSVPVF